ncbi:MAG: extracellular solute-binding protein [Clostridia bacterium]|nr:extracellular solute-binding protein [Clostridia bacterium]
MKYIHEDDLWVDRGRRPKTGVAKARKTNRIQTGVLTLLAAGLLLMVLFIAIALVSQRFPAGESNDLTSVPSGESVLVPDDDSDAQEPDLTIALHRLEWVTAFESLAKAFGTENDVQVEVLLISGYEDYQSTLESLAASNKFPDLIVVNGPDEAANWSHRLADLSDEPWALKTVFGLQDDTQHVIGFPIDLAAKGLVYNKSLLDEAGIDPAVLTNRPAWEAALQVIEKKKKQLGIHAPISLALHDGGQLSWYTSKYFLNIYLSSGLAYGNTQLIDQMKAGQVEMPRLQQFADYLDLLLRYSDQELLRQGSNQDQLRAFSQGQAVFTVGSSDLDLSLQAAGATFETGFLPFGAYRLDTNGIFAESTGWLVLDRSSQNSELAKDFLASLAQQEGYQDMLAQDTTILPAFQKNSHPLGQPLLLDLFVWKQAGRIYGLHQDQLPVDLGSAFWSPLIEKLAAREISSKQFAENAAKAIAEQAAAPQVNVG